MGSMMAPASSNSRAAASHGGAYLGARHGQAASGVQQQARCAGRAGARCPGQTGPRRWPGRQAHAVTVSGRLSTCIISAASATVRVMGPAARPGVRRVDRDATRSTGLEAENATPAGGQAQRAADIGAHMQGTVTGRSRCTGAGTAAAGVLTQVPGVARQPDGRWTGRRTACRSQAWWSCTPAPRQFPEPGRRRGVGSSRCQVGGRRAQRHRVAGCGNVVLDADRHAVERTQRCASLPAGLAGPGLRERQLRPQQVTGVQMRLPALDVCSAPTAPLPQARVCRRGSQPAARARPGRAGQGSSWRRAQAGPTIRTTTGPTRRSQTPACPSTDL